MVWRKIGLMNSTYKVCRVRCVQFAQRLIHSRIIMAQIEIAGHWFSQIVLQCEFLVWCVETMFYLCPPHERLLKIDISVLFVHQNDDAMIAGAVKWNGWQILDDRLTLVHIAMGDVCYQPQPSLGQELVACAHNIRIKGNNCINTVLVTIPFHFRCLRHITGGQFVSQTGRHSGRVLHLLSEEDVEVSTPPPPISMAVSACGCSGAWLVVVPVELPERFPSSNSINELSLLGVDIFSLWSHAVSLRVRPKTGDRCNIWVNKCVNIRWVLYTFELRAPYFIYRHRFVPDEYCGVSLPYAKYETKLRNVASGKWPSRGAVRCEWVLCTGMVNDTALWNVAISTNRVTIYWFFLGKKWKTIFCLWMYWCACLKDVEVTNM